MTDHFRSRGHIDISEARLIIVIAIEEWPLELLEGNSGITVDGCIGMSLKGNNVRSVIISFIILILTVCERQPFQTSVIAILC